MPSRHRRDSCPSDEVVGGFFFEFEAVRTEPRCAAQVAKRLEFIAKEVQKVDDQVKAKQDEQQKIGELIMKKQTELRAKAAEEAKKVYEEQMAKQA